MMRKLADAIVRSPKLLDFNQLYQKRCKYDEKYEQGRDKGRFDTILLAEMCPSSLLRYFLNSYSLVYECPCGKEYANPNSVLTHISRKHCGLGIFKDA